MKKIITSLFIVSLLSINSGKAQTWMALSTGLGSSTESIKAIAENPITHEIYAGGTFTSPVSYLAKWNGTTWEQVGNGITGPVYSLAFKDQELYVGGLFSIAGSASVNNIAKWALGSWSDVGGGFNGQVNCIFINTTTEAIYAGGTFSLSGSNTMNHVSLLLANNWTQLGTGIAAVVNTITEFNGLLYSGCDNLSAPVQKFDGNNWSAVSGISGGKVYALAPFSNYLYAGGDFSVPTFAAAKYSGTSWGTIQTTFSSTDKIYAFSARSNTVLYIGGKFNSLGIPNLQSSYAAKINSPITPLQTITSISSVLNGEVYAIGNQNGKVIVGGKFTSPASNIAITSTTIDVNELSNFEITKNFFPNPTTGKAHLSIFSIERLINPILKVYDLQSKQIKNLLTEININNNDIEFIFDCTNFPAGNYYYILNSDGNDILSDKFVIIHK